MGHQGVNFLAPAPYPVGPGPLLEDDTAARSVTWEEAKREEFLVDASDEARFGRGMSPSELIILKGKPNQNFGGIPN